MFLDITGFTTLMGEDEARAVTLRDKFSQTLEEQIALREGQIIQYTGDGALCSFVSASEAVRAAIAVQLTMLQSPQVPLRIGIHLADVVYEKTGIYGDGVNIAARLESLANDNCILTSAKVYDEIKNQNDIEMISLGKYALKNVAELLEIYAVSNAGLIVPGEINIDGKGKKFVDSALSADRSRQIIKIAIPLLALCVVGIIFIQNFLNKEQARNKSLPLIHSLLGTSYRNNEKAFDIAIEAEKYLKDDPVLSELWPQFSTTMSIETSPPGAEVFWKNYDTPDAAWKLAGITPIKEMKVPKTYLSLEIKKHGYQTINYATPPFTIGIGKTDLHLLLDKTGSIPENMVHVPAAESDMNIVGLEKYEGEKVPEFFIDKFLITNRQFKQFIDSGGYKETSYWPSRIMSNGKNISLDSASGMFRDKTGQIGPSTWEAGTYPDETQNHPVTGVSWYEASAYCTYADKQLPTVFHWSVVADTSHSEFIVPLSNFGGKSTNAVGSLPNISTYGIYDLAGNAREWTLNESSEPDHYFILGGGWNDPAYDFNNFLSLAALDRSASNGFRCMKQSDKSSTADELKKPLIEDTRDYGKEQPVDDKTFSHYLRQFNYDKDVLKAKIENSYEDDTWKLDVVSINAAYGNERMPIYIFLPKNFNGPFHPVIFFPSSNGLYSSKVDLKDLYTRIDFVLKSGRALIMPIYKSTFERQDGFTAYRPNDSIAYKDHVIMWGKDVSRTIDYLETRKDIQLTKLAYYGFSWGGFMGAIFPAIDKRIKVVVLNVGGLQMTKTSPEVDQINFLPRITQPILMMNGKYDMFFPVETSLKPMYNLLGTPVSEKKLIPRTEYIRETLGWLDTYLGPVQPEEAVH
jgi:dienelactone hydrolase